MRHYASLTRQDIRGRFAAFCDARPAGAKFAHRQTDGPAGSSPSMRWVNPPVAYMMHAGVPLLLDAGVVLPGLWDGNGRTAEVKGHLDRVALEAYPGLLAREIVGRQSYKNDDSARQDIPRRQARGRIVAALEGGHNSLAQTLELPPALRSAMLRDGSGDCLDAVLCLMQAAWAWRQGWPRYGVPPGIDPLEGWILTAPASAHAV